MKADWILDEGTTDDDRGWSLFHRETAADESPADAVADLWRVVSERVAPLCPQGGTVTAKTSLAGGTILVRIEDEDGVVVKTQCLLTIASVRDTPIESSREEFLARDQWFHALVSDGFRRSTVRLRLKVE